MYGRDMIDATSVVTGILPRCGEAETPARSLQLAVNQALGLGTSTDPSSRRAV